MKSLIHGTLYTHLEQHAFSNVVQLWDMKNIINALLMRLFDDKLSMLVNDEL